VLRCRVAAPKAASAAGASAAAAPTHCAASAPPVRTSTLANTSTGAGGWSLGCQTSRQHAGHLPGRRQHRVSRGKAQVRYGSHRELTACSQAMWLRRFRPTAAAWGSAGLMLLALIMVCVLTLCLCALLQCPVLPATASRAVDCPVRCVRSAPTHLEGAHPASHAHQEQQRSQRDRGSAVRQHNAAAAHSSTPHREQHSTAAVQVASALCQSASSRQVKTAPVHTRCVS
jgi:hypothetical protein